MTTKVSKTRVHTVYNGKDNKRLPSVTTVLGILSKPALIHWAWELGTKGEDYRKVRDRAGDIGTLAHYLIFCHLKGIEPDTSDYSPDVLNKAETCLLKYWEWENQNHPEPILLEQPFVSEDYGFGGTIDCVAKVNGALTLIDHKTGKAIYPEMVYQLAAYRQLLHENAYDVASVRILRIGRDETEDFEERVFTSLDRQWDIFHHCLQIYKLQKE